MCHCYLLRVHADDRYFCIDKRYFFFFNIFFFFRNLKTIVKKKKKGKENAQFDLVTDTISQLNSILLNFLLIACKLIQHYIDKKASMYVSGIFHVCMRGVDRDNFIIGYL